MNATASYNITNDKIKLWFDERLSAEDYKAARSASYVFWHGSKCFVAKWSTQAEDFALRFVSEINEDDSPDNVEARVERFSKYADSAEESAGHSQTYLEERANTERRRTCAANSLKRNLDLAEHWQRRIEGAIRHAAYKERPDVIARRIEKLEASLRKFQREADRKQWSAPSEVINHPVYDAYIARKRAIVESFRALAPNKPTPEQIAGAKAELKALAAPGFLLEPAATEAFEELASWAQRWISHIENRLLYERAALNAAGGLAAEAGLEKGGAVRCGLCGRNGWLLITKVNKKTVEVYDYTCSWRKYWKVDKTRIKETATAAQVESGEIAVVRPEQTAEQAQAQDQCAAA